jgi:limonene-1,2-epoxide hydrolase
MAESSNLQAILKSGGAAVRSAKIVEEFLAAWTKPGQWRSALTDYFTADCVYENVGLATTVGPAEAIAFVDAFNSKLPFVTMTVDMRQIVEQGNIVMTERTDRFQDASGAEIFSLRVMGIFEVIGGKIAAWRDYFDASPFNVAQ